MKGPTWQKNLNWTHQFFEYNVAPEVAEKVNELYMLYPIETACGGRPLLHSVDEPTT